jgi:uncharacterized protein (TIGR00730 family)
MMKNICVYASSSDAVAPVYMAAAERLGMLIAQRGATLIFGAGRVGLMGAAARGAQSAGGRIVGVIPEKLVHKDIAFVEADELVVTQTMRERKGIMETRADAFIALPGGIGTLEELLEVLVLKQLRYHTKPIVLINTQGFYHGLIELLERQITEQFARPTLRVLYHVAATPEDALDYLDSYTPPMTGDKWF